MHSVPLNLTDSIVSSRYAAKAKSRKQEWSHPEEHYLPEDGYRNAQHITETDNVH
jgi:hypothetical protein